MRAVFSISVLLSMLVGCADYNVAGVSDTAAREVDSDGLADDSGAEDSAEVQPTWFGLDAVFLLEEGQISSMTVTHRIYPDPPSKGLICSSERAAVEILTLEQTPDPLVWHWFEVSLGEDSGDCSEAALVPRTFRMGVGDFYPDLAPALADTELKAGNLYGSYASFEAPSGDGLEGTTYAYGYAGTPANRSGEAAAVEEGPLPDGPYSVTGWYLFKI